MKNTLRLEEFALFILSVYLNTFLPYSWWVYCVWFLAPDLSMVGYLFNTRAGAVCYNIIHHKGIAVGFYLVGIYFQNPMIQFTGLLLLGHSSFDRIFGYGLKHSDDFKHTHLGWIGK
jgi:hypothetical protein